MANIFANLFGKRKKDVIPVRDVSALTKHLATPAVHVLLQSAASRSHVGGSPELPSGMAWPDRNGSRLSFLARISLPEVQAAHPIDWLPDTGALLFFYDTVQQPWGFDPKDRGGWAVLLVPDLADVTLRSDGLSTEESPLPRRPIGFRRVDSFPSTERDSVTALDLTNEEFDAYRDFSDLAYGGRPKHQISGFPATVQGDGMELECQLASHGLYCGDSTGYDDARASSLEPGAATWRLLFQFDSDDDLDVMWGDCGTIYFWVEGHAARTGNFDNAWLVLQCC